MMSLRLYNTRTRAVEPFVPRDGKNVRMYVCGLTPSAEAHLGHARSFLFFDVLRRYLVHLGYRVTYVRNVTDIDDRSIAAAQAEGVSFSDVVERHLGSFNRSMDRLHVLEPDREPHATAYIAEIVAMIAGLIDGGHAYVAGDGVYYAVGSFARYGALSGRNTDELLIGARIAPGEDKRDPLDFALWKFAKPGEPEWSAPWGAGRPGWHIECSAMSHALLGEPLDIHGGGFDLIFPHHENEIAQSEALYAAPMANVWVHGGLLLFDGKKMSKSLGNFEPLSALLDRHDPQAIRLLFLRAGYRKPLNFTEASIDGATTALRRLLSAYDAFRAAPASPASASPASLNPTTQSPTTKSPAMPNPAVPSPPAQSLTAESSAVPNPAFPSLATRSPAAQTPAALSTASQSPAHAAVESYERRFFAALDDDMNTSVAVAVLDEVTSDAERLLDEGAGSTTAAFMHEGLTLLGLSPNERTRHAVSLSVTLPTFSDSPSAQVLHVRDAREERAAALLRPDFVTRLQERLGDVILLDGAAATAGAAISAVIEARNAARVKKDFALADRLRSALTENGVTLADSKEGVTWSVAG